MATAEVRDLEALREHVLSDRRALTEAPVKEWCGRRWRDLFIREAAADPEAVATASARVGIPGTDVSVPLPRDSRSDRQKVAERFLHRDAEDWRLELPDPVFPELDATLVFCPGLINTLMPVHALEDAFTALHQQHGWRFAPAAAHPMRSCEANIPDLLEAIEAASGDVYLLGYSKGAPDALTLLAHHPELADRVRAVVCWGGAVGGSYLADGIYELIKGRDLSRAGPAVKTLIQTLAPIAQLDRLSERLDEYDLEGAVRDLTTTRRAEFLAEHGAAIDALDIPIFNISAVTAPLEVPYFQLQGTIDIARQAGDNDMQLSVAQSCMSTPMATDLAVLHAHHWDLAYGAFGIRHRLGAANLEHRFSRTAAVAATVLLLAELGLVA